MMKIPDDFLENYGELTEDTVEVTNQPFSSHKIYQCCGSKLTIEFSFFILFRKTT